MNSAAPDPILTLADIPHARDFTLAGQSGRVIPQFMEAGSARHHTRFFYVEYPAHGGNVYQISMAKLASMLGDGAAARSFTAAEAATFIAAIPRTFTPHDIFRAISLT